MPFQDAYTRFGRDVQVASLGAVPKDAAWEEIIATDIHLEHRIFFQKDMLCNFGPHLEHLSLGWCSKCMSLSIGGCSKCMSVATKGKF